MLHWYLWLVRRRGCENDTRVITIQREQYGVTVHLFIGTSIIPKMYTIYWISLFYVPYLHHKKSIHIIKSD